jgi:hypothetical protein
LLLLLLLLWRPLQHLLRCSCLTPTASTSTCCQLLLLLLLGCYIS